MQSLVLQQTWDNCLSLWWFPSISSSPLPSFPNSSSSSLSLPSSLSSPLSCPFSPLSYFPPSLPSFFLPTPSLLLPLFYSSFLPSPPFSPLLPFSLLAFFPSLLCPWILSSVYMSSIFIYMRIISKFLSLVYFPQNSRSCLSTLHLYLDVLDSESTCAKLTWLLSNLSELVLWSSLTFFPFLYPTANNYIVQRF